MPPDRQPKQHRSAISDDLKRQICEWAEANRNKKHHEIAQHFNQKNLNVMIDRSTVSKILKEKDKWKAVVVLKFRLKYLGTQFCFFLITL